MTQNKHCLLISVVWGNVISGTVYFPAVNLVLISTPSTAAVLLTKDVMYAHSLYANTLGQGYFYLEIQIFKPNNSAWATWLVKATEANSVYTIDYWLYPDMLWWEFSIIFRAAQTFIFSLSLSLCVPDSCLSHDT